MGIKDLWAEALGDIKKKPTAAFSSFKGCTVGIDISVWFHRYCHTEAVALRMNSEPKYPPTELLAKFKSDHRALVDSGISPYYCFDGYRHPMKKVARLERDNKHNKAKQWLDSFYADARANRPIEPERRDSAMKYLKDVTNPDETITSYVLDWMNREGIAHECSLMEAEWQLVQLEKEKVIDVIMTTDGDAIVLGGKTILFDINFNKKQWKVFRQEEFLRGNAPLAKYPPSTWPAICSMLGSDYHARVPDIGFKRVFDVLPQLTDFEPEMIAAKLEEVYPTRMAKLPADYDYIGSLARSIALFKHPPVLDLEGNVIPLNPVPESVSWGEYVGLGIISPAELLPSSVEDYNLARRFEGPTFVSGNELAPFPVPCYTSTDNPDVPPNTPLSCYARLDFEKVPVSCLHSGVLQSFISA